MCELKTNKNYWTLYASKKYFFYYIEMVLKITKETWKKCGIKALYYYIKKKRTLELWLKMGDIKIELGH